VLQLGCGRGLLLMLLLLLNSRNCSVFFHLKVQFMVIINVLTTAAGRQSFSRWNSDAHMSRGDCVTAVMLIVIIVIIIKSDRTFCLPFAASSYLFCFAIMH
jgi:hypothetical protein